MKFRNLILNSIFVALIGAASVNADVRIADKLRFNLFEDSGRLDAQKYLARPLQLTMGDKLEVNLEIYNKTFPDLNVFVCPSRQVVAFVNGHNNNCYGVFKGKRSIAFSYFIPATDTYSVVLDNSYAKFTAKNYAISVFGTTSISVEQKALLFNLMSEFSAAIQEGFIVPTFDFNVTPCGHENAYSANSDGSITICSELLIRLSREKRMGALMGIFFHELGHTLLNLWGLPGWDNEQTVDEFSVYMLYQLGKQELAFDWASYFSEFDSKAEAGRVLYQDVRHPISIQRTRNILRILQSPREVISRWNNLVYPKMTDAGLRAIIDNPGVYGDRALAGSILSARSN